MSRFRVLLTSLLVAALTAAATAATTAAHPPDQHEAQLMPASALTTFNVNAQMAASFSASCEDGSAGPYPCENVDLAGFVPLPMLGGATGNDIWGWTDPETGDEYAIMGTSNSTGFVRVTDPENPVLVGVLPTRGVPDFVLWRDIKVHKDHAFIVSEVTAAGLQVFDLTRLRDRTGPTILTEDASYDGFSNAHNISINNESEVAYAVGTNTCRNEEQDGGREQNGGLHMLDVSDPVDPRFLGCATVQNADSGGPERSDNYVHDVECIIYDGPDADYTGREICFGSNEDVVVIYDVTDKLNPRVISATGYPTAAYTHQGSLTEDRSHFIFGDELDEQTHGLPTTTYIMDVRDLDNPPTPKAFEHETNSIDHNLYVHGNRVFASNYAAGLRILEFDDDSLADGHLEQVGYFDVVPGVDVAEFAGTWSNYRFPGSGNVVISAIENQVSGLFILTPTLPEPAGEEPDPGKGKKGDRGKDKPGKGGGNGNGNGGRPDRGGS
jgi:choice-of-anchor B domain-containing protein